MNSIPAATAAIQINFPSMKSLFFSY